MAKVATVPLNVERTISPADVMFVGNLDHYFSCGESALRILLEAIELSGTETPARILDFGAGAGRVTRWLKPAFPASSISCCDVREQDMLFLHTLLGAQTWTVGTDPDALDVRGRYDLIWVGSVITHLPETKTRALINRLLAACDPGGLLVLSFHGQFAVEQQEGNTFKYIDDDRWKDIKLGYTADGYGYADYIGQDGYGISVCTSAWMNDLVSALPGSRLVLLKARAWDHHHDVVAIQKMA
jgi:SAM-dependent methyltransferase